MLRYCIIIHKPAQPKNTTNTSALDKIDSAGKESEIIKNVAAAYIPVRLENKNETQPNKKNVVAKCIHNPVNRMAATLSPNTANTEAYI